MFSYSKRNQANRIRLESSVMPLVPLLLLLPPAPTVAPIAPTFQQYSSWSSISIAKRSESLISGIGKRFVSGVDVWVFKVGGINIREFRAVIFSLCIGSKGGTDSLELLALKFAFSAA